MKTETKRRAAQSLLGGVLVMAVSFLSFVLGGGMFYLWVMAWPAVLLKPFFPPPAPSQIFPEVGSLEGILSSMLVAALTYSVIIFLAKSFFNKSERFR